MTRRTLIGAAATAHLLLATAAHSQAVAPARAPFDPPERVDLATPEVTIPLTKEGEFYFAAVRINGRPFRFTVETGANFIGISSSAARALALPIDSISIPMLGGQQPQRTAVARIDSLSIGGATWRGMTARVTTMWDNQGFDGIVSIPFLQGLLARLDLSRSRLVLARGELPEPNGRDILAIARRDRAGRVDIMMEMSGISVPLVVDTRSFIPLTIPDSLSDAIRTEGPLRSIGTAAGPSQGTFQLRGGRLAGEARIGSTSIQRPPLAFRNRPGAVIGVPVLEQLDLTFDIAHGRVKVTPARTGMLTMPAMSWELAESTASAPAGPPVRVAQGGGPPAPASGQRVMGFNMAGFPGTSELRIINLIKGSDAERVGLRNDDVVIEFDGTPVAQMNPGVFRAAIARDTPTKVVVKRGNEQLTLSVKPYVLP